MTQPHNEPITRSEEDVKTQQCDKNAVMQQGDDATMQRCNDATMQQCNDAMMQ
jgi:hypothetical protein